MIRCKKTMKLPFRLILIVVSVMCIYGWLIFDHVSRMNQLHSKRNQNSSSQYSAKKRIVTKQISPASDFQTKKFTRVSSYHALVDSGWQKNFTSFTDVIRNDIGKTILLFNLPKYMASSSQKERSLHNCEYTNCLFSRDKSKLHTADAILYFVGIRDERMGLNPPIKPEERNPDQVWIFTSVEPPEHYYNTDYMRSSWHNTMNWSILYRLDSDIPNPYGMLVTKSLVENRNYAAIYRGKTRNALWLVSHCQAASARRRYVTEMIRAGFDVDVFGWCGSDGKKIAPELLEQIIPTYKFFLAFENSICNDYISEKFFRNYNLDWILVVRGGADYNRLLPANTFINTADFPNISSLVRHLTVLGNDRERYIEFLRNKDKYDSIRWPANRNCELCRRLNHLSLFRKTYSNIADFMDVNECFLPKDLW